MSSASPVVAIIGGGFSGAAVAYHLAGARAPTRIRIFEPRARLGAGLAYGGLDRTHRTNVPASRMSLLPDDDTHFARWLEASGVLEADLQARIGGDAFARRQDFGRYVDEALRPYLAAGRVSHAADVVTEVRRAGAAWLVRAKGGEEIRADLVVIATTHPESAVPAELRGLRGDPRLIANGLASDALASVQQGDRVLIVGSGLTAADIVASLETQGHCGPIVMISRRGLRSRGHAAQPFPPEGDFISRPARTATELIRNVRNAVRCAVASGRTWHPVFDALRSQGGEIWRALEPDARARVVRHLRPFWDVHRFRVAPQIDAVLDRKLANGSLELLKARLGSVRSAAHGLEVELRDARRKTARNGQFDKVIIATGPAHGDILRAQPYLEGLARQGAVALDSTGLGLRTSWEGRAIGSTGLSEGTLFIAGPLARGTFGELMGLPQVSNYACFIANQVLAALSEGRRDRRRAPISAIS